MKTQIFKNTYRIALLTLAIGLFSFSANAQADLTVRGYLESGDETANAGDRVSLEYVMSNLGNREVDDPIIGFFLSTDPVPSNDDYFLESEDGSDLEGYESDDESEQVPLPYSVPQGQYYVLIVIDPYNYVNESNESNNVEAIPITIF